MLNRIYITPAMALASGLTHEGTLFGVPAYFISDEGVLIRGQAKVPLLDWWCRLADWSCESMSGMYILFYAPAKVANRIAG